MATGLDLMLQQIREDADATAGKIMEEAREQEQEILAQAEQDIMAIHQENEEKISAMETLSEQKARSCAERKKRQIYLETRHEIISDVLERAKESLLHMDTEEYFSYLEKLLEKNIRAEEGIIRLNAADLKRVPEDFTRNVSALAKQTGGSLKLGQEPVDISGGFILIYGGIEENCSFESIFHAKREVLADELNQFLF